MWNYEYTDELYHHGVKGQKWGVRRYQNKDGSYKSGAEGRYNSDGSGSSNSGNSKMKSNGEAKNRMSDETKAKIKKATIIAGSAAAAAALGIIGGKLISDNAILKANLKQSRESVDKLLKNLDETNAFLSDYSNKQKVLNSKLKELQTEMKFDKEANIRQTRRLEDYSRKADAAIRLIDRELRGTENEYIVDEIYRIYES